MPNGYSGGAGHGDEHRHGPDQRADTAQAITEACLPRTADDLIIGAFDSPPVLDTSGVEFEISFSDRHPQNSADHPTQ